MKIIMKFVFLLVIISNLTIKGQDKNTNHLNKIYPIQDYARVLSDEEILFLNKKLISYYQKTSTEILVVIIKNLHGKNPKLIAYEWGEKLKIGQSYKDNGIIILLSIDDKIISIQNGYGIEPYVTDIVTGNIIKKVNPYLKNSMYSKALDSIINELFGFLKNKFQKKHIKKKIVLQKNSVF